MKIPTVSVVYDRKHVATKSNFKGKKRKGLVQIVVCLDTKRKWMGTGVRVYLDQWSSTKKVFNRMDMYELNSRIDLILNIIAEYINSTIRNKQAFSFEQLENIVNEKRGDGNFIDFAEKRIYDRGDLTDGSKRGHLSYINSLREFGKIVNFSDINARNIQLYDDWLHSRSYKQTTIYSYHKRNRRYINEAIRFEKIKDNPYHLFKLNHGKPEGRKYLTNEEIKTIQECETGIPHIDRVRDLFVFQCFTGLSYSDMAKTDFTKDLIHRNGKYMIADRRQKTNEDYFIVLLTPAIEILHKYDFKLPIITNERYNAYLKELATLAKLDKKLTSHMARHSFAVFALNKGVPIEVLAKMLGHSDIKTTQIYAQILNVSVENGFDMLEKAVCTPRS